MKVRELLQSQLCFLLLSSFLEYMTVKYLNTSHLVNYSGTHGFSNLLGDDSTFCSLIKLSCM